MNTSKYIESIYKTLKNNEQLLNNLDAAVGDGDFGTNIVRGFNYMIKAAKKFPPDSTLQQDLLVFSQILMSKIGGSSGLILGVALQKMSESCKNSKNIDHQTLTKMFNNAINGIQTVGKAKLGEKTLLDALIPAVDAFSQEKSNFKNAFDKGYSAATEGAENTKNMRATKGRASYLGDRSLGHMDAGACAIALIFGALAQLA